MILKEKPIDQKSDTELARDLLKVKKRDSWIYRHSKDVNHGIAVVLFAAGYYASKGLLTTGLAMTGSAGLPFVLGGMVAGPAIWALGAVGCAVGWARIGNGLSSMFRKKAADIQKEQADREYKKTPAYAKALQWAKQEAADAARELKKAFNNAVEKAFHTGTENEVKVSKPLQLKKPGAAPAPKKKTFLGMKL